MISFHKTALALGRISPSFAIWGLALLVCTWQVIYFLHKPGGTALSNTTYDWMVKNRLWAHPLDPRIIIIDIDEASLLAMGKEFGRWPWPRDTLATALDYLEQQNPTSITWDILFSDLDRLSPGGDKAFDEAARRSKHSVFPVVRLPTIYDKNSSVTQLVLPQLWLGQPNLIEPAPSPYLNDLLPQRISARHSENRSSVALIPPVLPFVASSRLGYNNGYPDEDGVLRRYVWSQTLEDQSTIQSLALSTIALIQGKTVAHEGHFKPLLQWRDKRNIYPRIPFHNLFSAAEGDLEQRSKLSQHLKGAVVLVGSTASSLHDIHASPLGSNHAGVDILATAIDNGLNGHFLSQIKPELQLFTTLFMLLLLALWIHFRDHKILNGGMVVLPTFLLLLSYTSLHGLPVFLDLSASATALLIYVGALKMWLSFRHSCWCDYLPSAEAVLAIGFRDDDSKTKQTIMFNDLGIERLICILHKYAPNLRLIGGDASVNWPANLRWPEMLNTIALVGHADELVRFKKKCVTDNLYKTSTIFFFQGRLSREYQTQLALHASATLFDSRYAASTPPKSKDLI